MKRAAWFIVSELLLIFLVVLVFSKWNGSVNFALGWPLSSCTLNITGGAQGGRVILAFISAILTVATFLLGLVRLFQREKVPAPPPPPPRTVPPPTPTTST